MEMHEKIYKRRKELGLTLEQVGKAVGVGKSTVRKWEHGIIANMRRDKIAALAAVLQTTPGYLMGWEDEVSPETLPDNILPIELQSIPLIGSIACGEPILAEENIELYVTAGARVHADFALRAKGDSMIGARIHDGDIVFIRRQPEVADGEIAAVLIGDEATLKRVYYDKDSAVLQLYPENPTYKPLRYTGADLDTVRILGKAVAFQGDVI